MDFPWNKASSVFGVTPWLWNPPYTSVRCAGLVGKPQAAQKKPLENGDESSKTAGISWNFHIPNWKGWTESGEIALLIHFSKVFARLVVICQDFFWFRASGTSFLEMRCSFCRETSLVGFGPHPISQQYPDLLFTLYSCLGVSPYSFALSPGTCWQNSRPILVNVLYFQGEAKHFLTSSRSFVLRMEILFSR